MKKNKKIALPKIAPEPPKKPKPPSFETVLSKHVLECKWEHIADRWIKFLKPINPPGASPDESISELFSFANVASGITEIGKPIRADAPGLREYVFREAVYLMHKAFHVSGCAENQVKSGYKTWSLVDAYQSSLFGAKAILCFCGIALAESNDRSVLIDIFPKEEDKQKRQKLKLALPDDPNIQFIKFDMKLGHRHVWELFKRVLNVLRINIWKGEYISAFKRLKIEDFSKQRNDLNYKNKEWFYNDLHTFLFDPVFGEHPADIETFLNYSNESDFSLCLSVMILRMNFLIFEDICNSTNILNPEINIIKNRLTKQYHPLYMTAYP